MPRILHPEWRKSHETTKYPFSSDATLLSDTGNSLLEGTFLDASLYPVGGGTGLRLSKVVVTHAAATISIGDNDTEVLASGTFEYAAIPDNLALLDIYGRPAGIIVSEASRWGILQSWGTGTHDFSSAAAEFVATVCIPTPEIGVRGFLLEDGSFFSDKVWIVGEDGVVVRSESGSEPAVGCDPGTISTDAIRVDIVGDPLFRRRLCQPITDLFLTPNPIRKIGIEAGPVSFECLPNSNGDFQLLVTNNLAADTVLRLRTTPSGVIIEAVGSSVSRPIGVQGG